MIHNTNNSCSVLLLNLKLNAGKVVVCWLSSSNYLVFFTVPYASLSLT